MSSAAPGSQAAASLSASVPAASTGGGFSFGGAASSAAAAAASSSGALSAGTAGSFGFLAASGASAASSAAGATTGSSFLFSSSVSATAASAGASAASSSAAAGAGANLALAVPGGSTPASVPSTSAAPAPAKEISELIGTRTVEEVINEWHRELQTDSKAFTQHANTIASWDRQLIQHRSFLLKLEADLGVVLASQDALERQLEILQVHQKQVDDVLEQVKGDLEQSYRESRDGGDAGDPAVQRDAMYESAEDISAKLSYMSNDLRETIGELNKASGFASGGALGAGIGAGAAATASDPLSAIVGILNNQLKALTWIDQQCNDIEGRMKVIGDDVKAPSSS